MFHLLPSHTVELDDVDRYRFVLIRQDDSMSVYSVAHQCLILAKVQNCFQDFKGRYYSLQIVLNVSFCALIRRF